MTPPGGIHDDRPPRLGGVLVVAGVILLVAGLGALGYGIAGAIGQAGAVADDAVATGIVSQAPMAPIPFESGEPELSVYLDFRGTSQFTIDSNVEDRAAAGTVCEVAGRDGFQRTLRGDRQGTAATIGRFVSVGGFALPSPQGSVSCRYERFSARLPATVPFLVTPHTTGEVAGPVLTIIGGVTVAGLGGWAAVAGLLRRRKGARLARLAA